MNLAKGNADYTTHLVRQSQKEVIEEDGGGRNFIILVAIAHFQS